MFEKPRTEMRYNKPKLHSLNKYKSTIRMKLLLIKKRLLENINTLLIELLTHVQ